MSARFIEDRHEVKLTRRIADIRPWTEKAAEALSERFTLVVFALPLLVLCALMPLLSLVLLPIVIAMIVAHRSARPILPMRYPAFNPEPDPVTKKPGNGIMFFGNQDSTSPYEKFKEIWGSDDDLRKHMLILGSTGSGKSETLKALFFNALCWSSGFFIADGKADNKLPTDVFTMLRSVGIDDNSLTLNFLLAGKTPEQVRRSRRRRTNKLNPFTSADADTIIQMGANMLPKVEGEGKNWQEKALNLWRAQVMALCYKRDTAGFELSVATLVEYMSLSKIEELYIEGYDEAQEKGEWSYGFVSIKTYLDSGCPAYKVDKLLAKNGRDAGAAGAAAPAFGAPRGGKAASNEQDSMAYEQHAYRTSQLMPVLNLLDKTYGHIFREKYPEIDMVDVTLNNRVMTMLIPSLEKSAQEAENLGKLAIACLRVMMSRNLGGGVEGTRQELLESKATNAPYPYLVALDELGYYFSDGIAVIFAQARSLGFSMIPAAQDLEKLTEGNRAAEAGAMMANSVTKIFLRIDDAKKTYEFVQGIVQKAMVAVYKNFEITGMGWRRRTEVDLMEVDRVSMRELQSMEPGQGMVNALGKNTRFRSYYMDGDLKKHKAENFYVLRFLQVRPPTDAEVDAATVAPDVLNDPMVKGERLRSILSGEVAPPKVTPSPNDIIDAVKSASMAMPAHTPGDIRAIVLYEAAARALRARQARSAAHGVAGGSAVAGAGSEAGMPPSSQPSAPAVQGPRVERPAVGRAAPAEPQSFDVKDLLPKASGNGTGRAAEIGGDGSSQRHSVTDELPPDVPPQDGSTSGDIDLDELFNPAPPFERKAVEALRRADIDESHPAPLSGTRLIDPVDAFLSGVRFFSMPKVVEPTGEQSYSDVVADLLSTPEFIAPPSAEGTAGPRDVGRAGTGMTSGGGQSRHSSASQGGEAEAGSAALDGTPGSARKPAARQEPATAAGEEDDWIADAVHTASRPPQPVDRAERSAVGFKQETVDDLIEIEAALGNENPKKAVARLENIMSEQLTPALRPEVPADDDMVMQLLGNLDSLGLGIGGAAGGKAPTKR